MRAEVFASAIAVVVGLTLAVSVDANAAGPSDSKNPAAASFKEGAAAYARGDFRNAAASFENAYRIAPRGAATYNAGLAWEGAGEGARAADAYTAALARGDLIESQAKDCRTRLDKLERVLGKIQVNAPADATVTIEKVGTIQGSATGHVGAGEHDVQVVYADGRRETRRIHVFPAALASVDFSMPAPAPVQPPPPSAPPPVAPPVKAAEPATAGSGGLSRVQAGLIVIGGAGIFAVTAGLLGQSALHARDDFDSTGDTNTNLHDKAASSRLWANVAWGGCAIAAGIGLYFVLTPDQPARAAGATGAQSAAISVGPGDVRVRMRF